MPGDASVRELGLAAPQISLRVEDFGRLSRWNTRRSIRAGSVAIRILQESSITAVVRRINEISGIRFTEVAQWVTLFEAYGTGAQEVDPEATISLDRIEFRRTTADGRPSFVRSYALNLNEPYNLERGLGGESVGVYEFEIRRREGQPRLAVALPNQGRSRQTSLVDSAVQPDSNNSNRTGRRGFRLGASVTRGLHRGAEWYYSIQRDTTLRQNSVQNNITRSAQNT